MSKDQVLITHFINRHTEIAIAEISELSYSEIAQLILNVNAKNQATILSGLNHRKAVKVLEKIPLDHSSKILSGLHFLSLELIFRNMQEEHRNALFEVLPSELVRQLKNSLSYSKNQIGGHLNPNTIVFFEDMTVQECIKQLKEEEPEANQHFFVLDKEKTLTGFIEATMLIAKNVEKRINSLVKPVPSTLTADMSVKDILENWNEAFFELPVVSAKGQFLGTITRQELKGQINRGKEPDQSAVKAGNALADLFLIGLTSLIGSPDNL